MTAKTRPSDKLASFVENGYRVTAFIPASEDERTEFHVEVMREADEKALFAFAFRMDYAPRFGLDSGDRAKLEGVTDTLLALLPDAAAYTAETLSLCQANAELQQAGVTFTAA